MEALNVTDPEERARDSGAVIVSKGCNLLGMAGKLVIVRQKLPTGFKSQLPR